MSVSVPSDADLSTLTFWLGNLLYPALVVLKIRDSSRDKCLVVDSSPQNVCGFGCGEILVDLEELHKSRGPQLMRLELLQASSLLQSG